MPSLCYKCSQAHYQFNPHRNPRKWMLLCLCYREGKWRSKRTRCSKALSYIIITKPPYFCLTVFDSMRSSLYPLWNLTPLVNCFMPIIQKRALSILPMVTRIITGGVRILSPFWPTQTAAILPPSGGFPGRWQHWYNFFLHLEFSFPLPMSVQSLLEPSLW